MVAGFLVICCRRTIPSTRVILRLGTSCVVSVPSSGSSPSCESGCIVDNLLRRWINFDLSLHCSIVPSGEKRALDVRVNSKFPMASFWLMSLLDLAKTISLPYKSLVSFRSPVLSRSFRACRHEHLVVLLLYWCP